MKKPCFSRTSFSKLSTSFLPAVLLLFGAGTDQTFGQEMRQHPASYSPFAPIPNALYESTFRKDNVEIFSASGVNLGLVGKIYAPTGLAFDSAGNLFVSSDNRAIGYSIKKVSAIDGTITTFANSNLNGPHGLAFDQAGNLYVANNDNNNIISYTPDGIATVFAARDQKLNNPIGLAFDSADNLFVTNIHGGLATTGKVIMITPTGAATTLVNHGLQVPYGIAFDAAGDFYVANNGGNFVEKYAPDGTDLGTFCSSGCNAPYGLAFDAAGNLYVSNINTATIEKYAPDGTDLGVFANTRTGPHFLAFYHPQTP